MKKNFILIFITLINLTFLQSQTINSVNVPLGYGAITDDRLIDVIESNNTLIVFIQSKVNVWEVIGEKNSRASYWMMQVITYSILPKDSLNFVSIEKSFLRKENDEDIKTIVYEKEEYSLISLKTFLSKYPNFNQKNLIYKKRKKSNSSFTFYKPKIGTSINTKINRFLTKEYSNNPLSEDYISKLNEWPSFLDYETGRFYNGEDFKLVKQYKQKEPEFKYSIKGDTTYHIKSQYASYEDGILHALIYKEPKIKKSLDKNNLFEHVILSKDGEFLSVHNIKFEVPHNLIYQVPHYEFSNGVKEVQKVAYFFTQKKDKKRNPNYDNTILKCIVFDNMGNLLYNKEFQVEDKFRNISEVQFKGNTLYFTGTSKKHKVIGIISEKNTFIHKKLYKLVDPYERLIHSFTNGDTEYLITSSSIKKKIDGSSKLYESPAKYYFFYKISDNKIEELKEITLEDINMLNSDLSLPVITENYTLAIRKLLRKGIKGFEQSMSLLEFYIIKENQITLLKHNTPFVFNDPNVKYLPKQIIVKGDNIYLMGGRFRSINEREYLGKHLCIINIQ